MIPIGYLLGIIFKIKKKRWGILENKTPMPMGVPSHEESARDITLTSRHNFHLLFGGGVRSLILFFLEGRDIHGYKLPSKNTLMKFSPSNLGFRVSVCL
jgi:hypothetical protein